MHKLLAYPINFIIQVLFLHLCLTNLIHQGNCSQFLFREKYPYSTHVSSTSGDACQKKNILFLFMLVQSSTVILSSQSTHTPK